MKKNLKEKLGRLNEFRKRFVMTGKEARELDDNIASIKDEFNSRTASYKGDGVWDLREYLMLLNLADNAKLGKTSAITYAYKLGYVDAQKE